MSMSAGNLYILGVNLEEMLYSPSHSAIRTHEAVESLPFFVTFNDFPLLYPWEEQ